MGVFNSGSSAFYCSAHKRALRAPAGSPPRGPQSAQLRSRLVEDFHARA
jgi:hypothetical protein